MFRTFALTAALVGGLAAPLAAQDSEITTDMFADLAMAEQLIALGMARDEPLLILAALRLRGTLGGERGGDMPAFTTDEDAIAAAKSAAGGDDAMMGLIDDVAAEGSRRMPICARNGVCY